MNKINNGRVDIKSPNTSTLFKMYDKIPSNQCVTFRNAVEGIWTPNALSEAYFSKENIQIIQNAIRAGIYYKSNGQYIIGPQDCEPLKIIMRSVYLTHAANQSTNITAQIEQLNKIVLNYCIQQVYGEAQGYIKYIDDVSTLVVPIALPVCPNNSDRTLEFKHWF
jgi:hypothetical protein